MTSSTPGPGALTTVDIPAIPVTSAETNKCMSESGDDSGEVAGNDETAAFFNNSTADENAHHEEKMRLDGITEKYNMIFDQWMKKAKGKLDNQVQST